MRREKTARIGSMWLLVAVFLAASLTSVSAQGWFQPPTRAIVIDGNFTDWQDESACLIHSGGGADHVQSVFVAQSATHVFYRFELDGPMRSQADYDYSYKFGHGRVHVNLDSDVSGARRIGWANGPEYPSISWPSSELSFAVASNAVQFEVAVPRSRVDDGWPNTWFYFESVSAWAENYATGQIDSYAELDVLVPDEIPIDDVLSASISVASPFFLAPQTVTATVTVANSSLATLPSVDAMVWFGGGVDTSTIDVVQMPGGSEWGTAGGGDSRFPQAYEWSKVSLSAQSSATLVVTAVATSTVPFEISVLAFPWIRNAAHDTIVQVDENESDNMVAARLNLAYGLVEGTPEINNFGHVVIGGMSTQTVHVANSGNTSLQVTSLSLTGAHHGDFSLQADGVTGQAIAPSGTETVTVDVVFSPTAIGGREAQLLVLTDDTFNPTSTVSLLGTGIDNSAAENSFQAGLAALRLFNAAPHDTNDFFTAKNSFEAAIVASASNHYPACVYGALTAVIGVSYDPDINNLMNQYGMSGPGRDIWNWTAVMPDTCPSNSPMTDASIDTGVQSLVTAVDQAIGYLGAIPETWTGSVIIGPNELPFDSSVQVDAGDIQMFQAGLSTLKGIVCILRAYELDIDPCKLDAYDELIHGELFDYLLDNAPTFATMGDAPYMGVASTALRNAIAYYQASSSLIRGETDYQVDDLVIFDPDSLPDEQEFRDRLANIDASFDAPVAMLLGELSPRVYIGQAFASPFLSPAMQPEYDAFGDVIPGTWPDPTFGGVLPDGSQGFLRGLQEEWPWPNGVVVHELERRPTFFWEQDEDATWYHLVINKDGGSFLDKWLAAGSTWRPDAPGLKGGTYTWRTQPYGPVSGLGSWSDWSTFTVTSAPPEAVTQIAPTGVIAEGDPTFAWSTARYATHYQLFVTRNGQQYLSQGLAGNTSTTYQHTAALSYGDYSWWVQSWNPDGSQWVGAMDFTYGIPQQTGPQGTITDRTPQFAWDAVAGATWYNVILYRSNVVYDSKWVQTTSYTPATDLMHGSYGWWVRAWGPTAGMGGWSEGMAFTIDRAVPGAVTPLSPTGNIEPGPPTFTWTHDTQASRYQLWVNRGSGMYLSTWVDGDTNHTPTAALRYGNYSWWVLPSNADGAGDWSARQDFSVGRFSLIAPSNDSTHAAGTLQYQWEAPASGAWYQVVVERNGQPFHNNWYRGADIVTGGVASQDVTGHTWGSYTWNTMVWSSTGGSWWEGPSQFDVGKPIPLSGTADTLTWDEMDQANWYQVWINRTTGGTTTTERQWWFKVADTTPGTGSFSIGLAPALGVGSYEWSIRAWSNVNGMGPWSETQGFVVE